MQAELNAGADVMAKGGYNGETLLHYAGEYGAADVIETLMTMGADVTALDDKGKTPLHKAVRGGTPEGINALILAGADVMAQDSSGDTPLHAAAEINGATDVKNNILALLAAGADVMVPNKDKKIPWDYAKDNDDIDETDKYTALGKATCGWSYSFKNFLGLCN